MNIFTCKQCFDLTESKLGVVNSLCCSTTTAEIRQVEFVKNRVYANLTINIEIVFEKPSAITYLSNVYSF